MSLIARLFVMCCMSLLSLASLAAPVDGLYQVREAVLGQQAVEREQVLRQALDTLVLRLSGDPAALENPAVIALREKPQRLISQYAYEGNVLVVDFDPATSTQALSEAGLPLWGADRPAVLVWWLNESSRGSHLVGDAQESSVLLRRAAQHRGLPLQLPLADLSEQWVGTPSALSGKNLSALRDVSARYTADTLVTVYARQARGSQWQAHWRLWHGEQLLQGQVAGANPAVLSDAVLLAVQQALAPLFVVRPGGEQTLTLVVGNADLPRYAELERLLQPFTPRLLRAEGKLLTYQLRASPEQLRAQLALARLQELPAATVKGEGVIMEAHASVLRFQ